MAKERQIRAKAIEIIQAKGGIVWYPPKVKFHQTDLFGIWDLLILYPPGMLLPVQLTSLSNASARKNKIQKFYQENKISFYCEVWAWDDKKGKFRIIPIYE